MQNLFCLPYLKAVYWYYRWRAENDQDIVFINSDRINIDFKIGIKKVTSNTIINLHFVTISSNVTTNRNAHEKYHRNSPSFGGNKRH